MDILMLEQEGIHFDLEHRNRIPWNMNDLPGFRDKLTKRINSGLFGKAKV